MRLATSGERLVEANGLVLTRAQLLATARWRNGVSSHATRRHTLRSMYDVDGADRVVRLRELPECDVGAPMPALAAAEHHLEVGYIARPQGDDQETIAVVHFARPYAHFFGPPNDEAFEGHPLAGRGLEPYGAFRIEDSSWIRRLERMNAVHEYHRPEAFAELVHFVLTFHDTTFECVAATFEFVVHPADEALTLAVQVTP